MKNTIHNAYVALLSGLTKYKPSTKEIIWEDRYKNKITVEILDAKQKLYVIRYYYESGKLHRKNSYKNDQMHGEQLIYYGSGNLQTKNNYKNGQRHGEQLVYNIAKNLYRQYNYKNGIFVDIMEFNPNISSIENS